MTDDKSAADRFDQLRKRAEELISARPDAPTEGSSSALDLINELEIHQVELEIQNEELKQAHRELSALQREYEDLYEFAPCGYVTLNAKGMITRANLTAVTLLGVDRSALLRSGFIQFISPEKQGAFIDAGQEAGRAGEKRTVEVSLNRNDPATPWVRIDIVADREETGAVTRWRMAMTDITDHKQMENALKKSEEHLRLITNNISALVSHVDRDLNCLFANRAYVNFCGVRPGELVGKKISEVLNKDAFNRAYPHIQKALKGEFVSLENHLIREDGHDLYFQISYVPHFEANEVLGYFVLAWDITERKRAEAALQESELFFKTVIQHSPLGIGIVNSEGDMTECNKALCHLLGYKREELLQLNFSDFTHPNDLEKERALIQEMWNGATSSYQMEKRYIHKNQNIIWVNVFAAVIIEDGKMKLGFAFVEDITDRKRAEAALQKSLAEKEVLLCEIHHRVKNNMQAISGLLRMHARRTDDAHLTEIFDDCRDRIGAMALIHEALYQSDNLAEIDFGAYLKKLCRNLAKAHDAGKRGVTLTANAADVSLNMDQGVAVGMIIAELISNAFKHAFSDDEEGTVSVGLDRPDGETFRLVVSDTGKGLPPDFDMSASRSLGMRLVWGAVTRELGGSIEATNDGGATFVIRFKCDEDRQKK